LDTSVKPGVVKPTAKGNGEMAEVSPNAVQHQVSLPIIETMGISKVYHIGDDMVSPATDITMQIGYGDFAVIFGPSGAGKSTLLNMLMGLEKPDVGEVFLKGESLYGYSEEERTVIRRKKLSYLPQSQYWLDFMDVTDNVAVPLILQGWSRRKARKRALEALEEVGMKEFSKHQPVELSTGQQQKAAIARAIIKQPWVIYADEPTAHLDSKSVEEVTKILFRAADKYEITIVMVTHDLNFLKLSKKWFFMQDGRIWDIKDRRNPFNNIREAISYVEEGKANQIDDDAGSSIFTPDPMLGDRR
jgi:putative ABC transport system ATP-binding protein